MSGENKASTTIRSTIGGAGRHTTKISSTVRGNGRHTTRIRSTVRGTGRHTSATTPISMNVIEQDNISSTSDSGNPY